MAAAAHDPKFAKKVGVPQKVAREFNQADKGRGIIGKSKAGGVSHRGKNFKWVGKSAR